jgi:hypothetical protein
MDAKPPRDASFRTLQPGTRNVEPFNPGIIYSDLDKPTFQSYVIVLNHQSSGIELPDLLGRPVPSKLEERGRKLKAKPKG